jgi:hypothetical protein
MAEVDQRVVEAIVSALPHPESSHQLREAVARLIAAHLQDVDRYAGCWIDDIQNVRILRRASETVMLGDGNWQKGHGGPFHSDPIIARFKTSPAHSVPYTLGFGAEERPTRKSGHIRKEVSEDWTWLLAFEGELRRVT